MLSSSSLGAQLNSSSSSSSSCKPSSKFVIPSRKNSVKDSIFVKLNPFPFSKLNLLSRHATQPTSSSTIIAAADDSSSTPEPEKLGVVVKLMEKPRIVLKFIWVDRNLGLALDQVIPGHGSIPLGPYYFWPRKDAWDELKIMLESKPWLSQKQVDVLLNQATDIINMWQKSDGNQS